MNFGLVEPNLASTMSATLMSGSRRRKGKSSNQPDRLNRRDVEFMHQTVSVVKKIGEFHASYIYSAKGDYTGKEDIRSSNSLFIKATAAATTEEARQAEAEVRLLRKLSQAPGIPKMIDCGFSTIDERVIDYGGMEDQLDVRRLYCVLFESCPDMFVSDFIKKRRRKYDSRRSRGLFVRKRKEETWEGYLPINVVLDIFGQMAVAISALHAFEDDFDSTVGNIDDKPDKKGIVHLNVQPGRFLLRRLREKGQKEEQYQVTLCSFGCSIRGSMPLTSDEEREKASEYIEGSTTPIYRSPEMINLRFAHELNCSADVWGLGCCFYALLFLTDCFKSHSKLDITRGAFSLPPKHPYKKEVIDLLARMLTVNPIQRPSIHDVLLCVDCLKKGKSLPPRTRQSHKTGIETGHITAPMEKMGILHGKHDDLSNEAVSSQCSSTDNDGTHTIYRTAGSTIDGYEEALGTWEPIPGGHSSDGTELSQWLEFQPNSSDGSNLEQKIEPVSPASAAPRRALRRRRRKHDPLSLGPVQNEERKRFADWTLGLISQLSTRSLNPIDTTDAPEVEGANRDPVIAALREPSLRKISPFGVNTQRKNSFPNAGQHPYGRGFPTFSGGPSLRVSDLFNDSSVQAASTSSTELQSSANASSGRISTDRQTSSVGSIEFGISDMSASITHTPTKDKSSFLKMRPLDTPSTNERSSRKMMSLSTPQSAPDRTRNQQTLMGRGMSPNEAPQLPFTSRKEIISPRVPELSSDALDFPSSRMGNFTDLSALSERKISKSKKFKKDKRMKDKSSKNKRKQPIKGDANSEADLGSNDILRASVKSAHTAFSNPDFYPEAEPFQEDETSVNSVGLGEVSPVRTWTKRPERQIQKTKSEPMRGWNKGSDIESGTSTTPLAQHTSTSALNDWDLKAAEQWVATKSMEASGQEPQESKLLEAGIMVKDLSSMKIEKIGCSEIPDVPANWLNDAGQWVKTRSPKRDSQTSMLREEMKKELIIRPKQLLDSEQSCKLSLKGGTARLHSPSMKPSNSLLSQSQSKIGTMEYRSDSRGRRLTSTKLKNDATMVLSLDSSKSEMVKSTKKEYRSTSRRNTRGRTSAHKESSSERDFQHRKSQQSVQTLTSSKGASDDSNFPSEDEVLIAEVSVPSPEQERGIANVKEEVQMVLTAKGRKMRHSMKKIERESPNELSMYPIRHEKIAANRAVQARLRSGSLERTKQKVSDKMSKSAGSIPSLIEMRPEIEIVGRSSFTPNRPKDVIETSRTNASWSTGIASSMQPSTPLPEPKSLTAFASAPKTPNFSISSPTSFLSPETPMTPSRKSKKKKRSKSKGKDREKLRNAKSERVNVSDIPESTSRGMSKSMTSMDHKEGLTEEVDHSLQKGFAAAEPTQHVT